MQRDVFRGVILYDSNRPYQAISNRSTSASALCENALGTIRQLVGEHVLLNTILLDMILYCLTHHTQRQINTTLLDVLCCTTALRSILL
eukprot:13256-Heterococcus_DN1.PRE.2